MTTERDSRPEEHCPSWCEGEHDTQLAQDETRHQSPAAWFPVVRLQRRRSGGRTTRDAVAEEMGVLAVRYAGDRETWIALATEGRQLELTPESAARLRDALSDLLPHLASSCER